LCEKGFGYVVLGEGWMPVFLFHEDTLHPIPHSHYTPACLHPESGSYQIGLLFLMCFGEASGW
jgi:hypothetical protein